MFISVPSLSSLPSLTRQVQAALDAGGRAEVLHYITHSWLVHMFMNCAEWELIVGERLDTPLHGLTKNTGGPL